ncbi:MULTISPECIES: 30S ribosomal protein S20 [Halobacillus]|uniref:Small ribosomal subunit protein bS20 n=2 Tax=Halobacillus TaxID=45667 RepID=I0JP57_HALH3|nr:MULTISPECIES: 30S ribosomal protein S20 [Halobacillus]ASF39965.1 30S ribosomal protein S20 [Halobacillus halophilus]MCA1009739.1 30S ribosomal protein S20 [Halobacillus halophilus]CCG45927.1 30S ribosomal protein S20 [Halobacillus halophilus DSM 2266]SFF53290.1 SSU ribosomal protein S20P [Halobacillus alkaliphilus]
MPNIKSAKKRVRINDEARYLNAAFKSDMRTAVKRVEKLVSSNEKDSAKDALSTAVKKIDKAVQRGALHKNNGNRTKSRLSKKVNAL